MRATALPLHHPTAGRWRGAGVFWLCFSLLLAAQPTLAASLTPIAEPPPDARDYDPPTPGSYTLMRIMPAGDGEVLDDNAQTRQLAQFTHGKVTLLSFIYSSCADPAGCPLTFVVFHQLKDQLERQPELAKKIRLVSLSFDPKRDTPEVMKLYGGGATDTSALEWRFLTTRSNWQLLPILDAYGQDVFRDLDPRTHLPLSTFSHMLKVFLIDPSGTVREIYSSVYLRADVVYNDLLTLLLEQHGTPP
jgi:cytochrome oxidase Cu insertion factor (SCO1/SenC/PrrC family)